MLNSSENRSSSQNQLVCVLLSLKLVAETRQVASYTETHLFRRSDTYHRDARQKVHGRYPKALTFEGAQYLTA